MCDGVYVEPGDLVVADGDGVIVIPRLQAEVVVSHALERKNKEDAVRQLILKGDHPWHLHACDKNYEKLAIQDIQSTWNQL